jgi:hypothetical protein
LLAGDTVPAGQDPASTTLTPNTFSFPLLVWQGPLRDGVEAVVVRPTLWVWNGGPGAFDDWARFALNQLSLRGRTEDQWEMNAFGNKILNADLSPLRDPSTDHSTGMLFCSGDPTTWSSCRPGNDRPIGLTLCDPRFTDEISWCDLSVVVTREAIEKALASPYQAGGLGKGVIAIHLADDGSGWNGNYDLYLRVERAPQ